MFGDVYKTQNFTFTWDSLSAAGLFIRQSVAAAHLSLQVGAVCIWACEGDVGKQVNLPFAEIM